MYFCVYVVLSVLSVCLWCRQQVYVSSDGRMSVWVDRQVAMDGYLSIPLNGRTSAMFDYSTYFSAQSYTKHFIIASFMYVFATIPFFIPISIPFPSPISPPIPFRLPIYSLAPTREAFLPRACQARPTHNSNFPCISQKFVVPSPRRSRFDMGLLCGDYAVIMR